MLFHDSFRYSLFFLPAPRGKKWFAMKPKKKPRIERKTNKFTFRNSIRPRIAGYTLSQTVRFFKPF